MLVPCPACGMVVERAGTVCSSNRWIVPVLCTSNRSLFCALEHVKEKGDSQNVDAVFQLGRRSLSRGLSKNVYERFLFSRSFHSPPTLKAASPADFA